MDETARTIGYGEPTTPPAWRANPLITGTVGGGVHLFTLIVIGLTFFKHSMRQIDGIPLSLLDHVMKVLILILGFPLVDVLIWFKPPVQAPIFWFIVLLNSVLWGIAIGLSVHFWNRRRNRRSRV